MSKAHRRTIQLFVFHALVILVCEGLNAIAYRALIVPARLLSGGVVGSALLINQIFGLPIGLQTIVYNIPIFLLGFRYLGQRFVLLSIWGVLSFSFLLDNLVLPRITQDLLLVAVFGGVVTGIADGIILRTGGSTGGLDIIGLIVSRRFGVSIGQVFLVFNGLIIGLGALVNRHLEIAMYTLIMLYVSARVVDAIQAPTPRCFVLVISAKHQEIADRILKDLQRGVTYLEGMGAYTETEFRVMLCVLTRYELVELRVILNEIDSSAFTVVLPAQEVIGRFDQSTSFRRLLR